MRPQIHVDFETKSTIDLMKTGVHRYARDETTDTWCAGYKIDDGETKLWTPDTPSEGDDLLHAIKEGGDLLAWNAAFEYNIWNLLSVPRYGWPELALERTKCVMARSYALGLPGALAFAAKAVGLDLDKDMEGRKVMMQMAKPRRIEKDGTIVWWDDFTRRERLGEYCKVDVEVETLLDKKLLHLPKREYELWKLDQKINNRGVYIDLSSVNACRETVEKEKKAMNARVKEITEGALSTANQAAKMTEWCNERSDLNLPSVAKDKVLEALDKDMPDDVRELLTIRQAYAKSSTGKLDAMVMSADTDGRARGLFQYHGASTGRWAGRRIQLQNMPRPTLSNSEILWAAENIQDAELIRAIYGAPMKVVADCLRSMLMAAPGHRFLCADYSAIEARCLPWLAGEEDVLDVFRSGEDIYLYSASRIFGHEVTKADFQKRLIGKVSELALGYGGGIGAFQSMAVVYGVKVEDEEADKIKAAWRESHPNVVQYWKDVEEAAKNAVRNKGKVFTAGAIGREVAYKVVGSFLFCRLPSGRCLAYAYPCLIDQGFYRDGNGKVRKTYPDKVDGMKAEGLDAWKSVGIGYQGLTDGHWGQQETYGGKLVENITQAVARDLLAEAMFRLEDRGYKIVMHVHDEVVCEMPHGQGSLKEMEDIMSELPDWADDLPVEAEGWEGKRFRK